MIYNRVQDKIAVNMDDMERIVSVANIAGYLENAERIVVEDDRELTKFCLAILEQYYREDERICSFLEYAEAALLDKYRIEILY